MPLRIQRSQGHNTLLTRIQFAQTMIQRVNSRRYLSEADFSSHRYAADLKKRSPHPQVQGRERFEVFVQASRDLADLHINYSVRSGFHIRETKTAIYSFNSIVKLS